MRREGVPSGRHGRKSRIRSAPGSHATCPASAALRRLTLALTINSPRLTLLLTLSSPSTVSPRIAEATVDCAQATFQRMP